MKNNKPKTAFTFIELSLVLALIGIVAVLVATGGSYLLSHAKLSAARSLTANSPVRETPDLALWLETTLKDSFIISERDSTSHAISTWYDQNPQMDFKKNATAGNAPTYVANGMNGLPVLRFNGSTNYLNYSGTFLVGTNYTIFVVEQRRTTSRAYFIAGGIASTNSGLHLGYRSNTIITHGQYASDYDMPAIAGYTNPIPRIHTFVHNSVTGKKYYLNGSNLNSSPALTSPLLNNTTARIAQTNWAGNYYNGDIAEIIIFTRTLSDAEIQDIESYLSKKWGIKFY